jgi:hypothetical protein
VTLMPAAVLGLGLWRPASVGEVPPRRLPPQLRRRSSLLINMVAEVAHQATEEAGASLSRIPIIVGSAYGELGTTMDILRDLAGEGVVSPTKFQSSVHNSAVGYLSIAEGNRAPSTSVAAGDETLAMVLLEAFAHLAERGGQVLAVIADEPAPGELRPSGQEMPWAGALLLEGGARGDVAMAGRSPLALLQDLRAFPADAPGPGHAAASPPGEVVLGLVEAIRAGRPAHVLLGRGVSCAWSMSICRSEGP